MSDGNLAELAEREKKQTHSIEDIGRARSFLKNSSVIKLFAKVSRQAGSELELCRDKVIRDLLLKGDKSSRDLDIALEVLKMYINIFNDCEETIYEEEQNEKDVRSSGDDE